MLGACSVESPPPPTAVRKLGINLSPVNYYATQAPFADVFRSRDAWTSTDGETWDTMLADGVPLDADGYPLEVPYQGQMMRAATFLPIEANTFDVTWQGDGELSVQGPDVKVTARADQALTFSVAESMTDSVFVRIDRSSRADHVRGISIQARKPYDALFKNAVDEFGVLRFMDWGATNDNPLQHWSERITPAQAQGTARGVAIETMVDAANAAHADMWFNVPHQVDDDYIQRAAQLIEQRLDASLKVYVEYSNENWNPIFSQVDWEKAQGLAARLDQVGVNSGEEQGADYWAGLKFSARRAAVAHATFRRVLGAGRVVAVLAGQSGSPALNDQLLESYEDRAINPVGGHPDALAVAPYFGTVYRDDSASDLSVDDILDDAEASIEDDVAQATRDNRKVANKHGVRLIAYEAGQHLLALDGLEDDDDFVSRLIAANRDPRMGELYQKAHRAWVANGGELVVYFNLCQAPSKYGAWGALEYQDQPADEAPKWQALRVLASSSK